MKLDTLIHDQFLEVNKVKSDSQFVYAGKTIGQTIVRNGEVKGYFIKKDGELSKTVVNIVVDKNYKIVK